MDEEGKCAKDKPVSVLIVDDDEDFISTTKEIFDSRAAKLLSVRNFGDFVEIMDRPGSFNGILLDLSVEKGADSSSGVSVAKWIKQSGYETPIFGFSSRFSNLPDIGSEYFDDFQVKGKILENHHGWAENVLHLAHQNLRKTSKRGLSVFISYGGPDEGFARRVRDDLESEGIHTWFFPEDALPGQKLHRVMSEGVNIFDRVLLICSQNSLVRPGVLNELERVLEREAREGGIDVLIPVALDNFATTLWAPERSDLADQLRSRVIGRFYGDGDAELIYNEAIKRVKYALLSRED